MYNVNVYLMVCGLYGYFLFSRSIKYIKKTKHFVLEYLSMSLSNFPITHPAHNRPIHRTFSNTGLKLFQCTPMSNLFLNCGIKSFGKDRQVDLLMQYSVM